MNHPSGLRIKDFWYDLPEERIAKYPLPQRDSSKLLVFNAGRIQDHVFSDLPELLSPGSSLYFNDSRVLPARMFFKTAEKHIEIFLIEPSSSDYSTAFAAKGKCRWKVMVGGLRKWNQSLPAKGLSEACPLELRYLKPLPGTLHEVEFSWAEEEVWLSVLEIHGQIPIPPYLRREVAEGEDAFYQTVYAKNPGSVAAPTAGLHFTQNVFDALAEKHIRSVFLTLHVSSGTFRPVKAETMAGHEMHAEWIEVTTQQLQQILEDLTAGRPLIAVGTTSLRTLETLYWMGVKIKAGKPIEAVSQWDPYSFTPIPPSESIGLLLEAMIQAGLSKWYGVTSLLIAPPYQTALADGLITNFHQPGSTLLLLVAAVTGKDHWKEIYRHALDNEYRFLSYGDSSLLETKRLVI